MEYHYDGPSSINRATFITLYPLGRSFSVVQIHLEFFQPDDATRPAVYCSWSGVGQVEAATLEKFRNAMTTVVILSQLPEIPSETIVRRILQYGQVLQYATPRTIEEFLQKIQNSGVGVDNV